MLSRGCTNRICLCCIFRGRGERKKEGEKRKRREENRYVVLTTVNLHLSAFCRRRGKKKRGRASGGRRGREREGARGQSSICFQGGEKRGKKKGEEQKRGKREGKRALITVTILRSLSFYFCRGRGKEGGRRRKGGERGGGAVH